MNFDRTLIRRSMQAWINSDLDPVGPAWLRWLWTLLFAALIALGFTVLGFAFNARDGSHWLDGTRWWRWYRINFVVSLTISIIIHLLFQVAIPAVGRQRIRGFSNAQRAVFFTAIPMSGVILGWPLGAWLVSGQVRALGWIRFDSPGSLVGSAILALSISFLFFLFFNAKARQALAEKRAAEAQLRLLQAQMEPHFLFNTLANVLTLIDLEPQRAKAMLETFTDYLRATLAKLRQSEGSVGGELDLADAYLRLLQLRMEDRLQFSIDAPPDTRQAVLPPLMLQPLVENAIHHGLEPKLEGGSLAIQARVQEDQLTITVSDDGLGPAAPQRRSSGNGIALANIRERLQVLYGDAASLSIEARNPGTRATLRLPYTRSPACPWR